MTCGEENQRRFVVGLGNPGRRYRGTRHNLGFVVVAKVAERWALTAMREAFGGRVMEGRPSRGGVERRVMLLTPQTYMNRSGQAVREMTAFYKAEPQDVLIVLDDLALPPEQLRARVGGSAGGHNGLADVLDRLGSDQVPRLRIGIGPAPDYMDPADYVLQAFRDDELEPMEHAVQTAADAVEDWVFNGITFVMDTYNGTTEA